jgi:hypothetical protein
MKIETVGGLWAEMQSAAGTRQTVSNYDNLELKSVFSLSCFLLTYQHF